MRIMHSPFRVWFGLIMFLCLHGLLVGQELGGNWAFLYRHDGPGDFSDFGHSVALGGDLNQDGFCDLVIGTPGARGGGNPGAGTVYVYSGRTGSQLYRWIGFDAHDRLGFAVDAAGDINGDGVPDLILGAPGAFWDQGRAYLVSGYSGNPILEISGNQGNEQLGYSVSELGDVNGDGFGDLVIGALLTDSGGIHDVGGAFVISGSDGSRLFEHFGNSNLSRFGAAVDGGKDVNGDGTPDYLVSAYQDDPSGLTSAGTAWVYSGANGATLYEISGEEAGDEFGKALALVDDLNQDQFADFLISAPEADANGLTLAGKVYLYSGKDGSLLQVFTGEEENQHFGSALAGAGDVDDDGFPEILIGASKSNVPGTRDVGAVYLLTSRTWQRMTKIRGKTQHGGYGDSLAGGKDVNGDGLADWMVGGPREGDPTSLGAVFTYSYLPYMRLESHLFSLSSNSSLEIRMKFPLSEAGQPFTILFSAAGTGPTNLGGVFVPLTPDPFFQSLLAGWTPPNLQDGTGRLNSDATGLARFHHHAALVPHVGKTFYGVAITLDAGKGLPRLSSVAQPLTILP
ncbi:MAG: hypothetical protein DWQ01_05490 [Planctomycetota bacterium]|nr:MAG: hypothetical protein DWQ01_05490 [Planctomycetota bacterium]